MSETDNTQGQVPADENTTPNPPVDPQGQAPTGTNTGDPQGNQEHDEASSLEELPQWARDQITQLRRESASYRTERNDLRERIEAAKDNPEDNKKLIEQLQGELREASLKAKRLDIARKNHLPESADVLLHGDDENTLSEQAKVLAQLFGGSSRSTPAPPVPQTPPTNPRNPQSFETEPDIRELLDQASSRRTY